VKVSVSLCNTDGKLPDLEHESRFPGCPGLFLFLRKSEKAYFFIMAQLQIKIVME
jgi:hypothetical protein